MMLDEKPDEHAHGEIDNSHASCAPAVAASQSQISARQHHAPNQRNENNRDENED